MSTIDIVGSSFMNLQSSHRYQEEEEEEGESEEKACQHNLQDRAKAALYRYGSIKCKWLLNKPLRVGSLVY